MKIGLQVNYHPDHRDLRSDIRLIGNGPLLAFIVHAHGEHLVNLVVFDSVGVTHRRENVFIKPNGETDIPANGYATLIKPINGKK